MSFALQQEKLARLFSSMFLVRILTDAGLPVLVQTETPATETLKGAGTVLAGVITTAISSQTLVYI